jgi:hypothetical protein
MAYNNLPCTTVQACESAAGELKTHRVVPPFQSLALQKILETIVLYRHRLQILSVTWTLVQAQIPTRTKMRG